ncbi:MAG: hypothetical protein ACYSTS_17480 [Planctomycetota bacterium]|jgi:tetratricopeptide (TPR) repeat protein
MNKFYKFQLSRTTTWSWYIILVVLIYLSAGCANISSVNHLHQAQQAFNNAASIENYSRINFHKPLSQDNYNPIVDLNIARSGYTAALEILRQMPDEEKNMLVKDRLWGVKLTLEALTLWRLGKYEEAFKIIQLADGISDQIYPRDAAILTALPGLIKIDLAYQKILEVKDEGDEVKKEVLKNVTQRLVAIDNADPKTKWSAVQTLKKARAKVNKEHPVNSYLIQSQLIAYRNYKVAYTSISTHISVPDNQYRREAMYNLHELKVLLKELNIISELVGYWKNLCNIEVKERP